MSCVCTVCHSSFDSPKSVTPGSAVIELILWGLFLAPLLSGFAFGAALLAVPALLYTGYRLAKRRKACPKCGAGEVVGSDTPRGVSILSQVAEIPAAELAAAKKAREFQW